MSVSPSTLYTQGNHIDFRKKIFQKCKYTQKTESHDVENKSSTPCPECNQSFFGKWCLLCESTRTRPKSLELTSGDSELDKYIQQIQSSAKNCEQFIEWIPFEKFSDIKEISKSGSGKVSEALWNEGPPLRYRISINFKDMGKKYILKRAGPVRVALKELCIRKDNSLSE
ncbi:12660_t:CDS:1, partial [Dentiscutata erythropus]